MLYGSVCAASRFQTNVRYAYLNLPYGYGTAPVQVGVRHRLPPHDAVTCCDGFVYSPVNLARRAEFKHIDLDFAFLFGLFRVFLNVHLSLLAQVWFSDPPAGDSFGSYDLVGRGPGVASALDYVDFVKQSGDINALVCVKGLDGEGTSVSFFLRARSRFVSVRHTGRRAT